MRKKGIIKGAKEMSTTTDFTGILETENVRGKQRKTNPNKDGSIQYRLRPKDRIEMHGLYNEYVTHCQQTYHTIPDFHNFMIQMAKIGFLAWQEKNKI
jgi:hypothetical protein